MNVEEKETVYGRRGQTQVARWMGMYFCQTLADLTLAEIANKFNITHVSVCKSSDTEIQTTPEKG